jgi:hypothetical protein
VGIVRILDRESHEMSTIASDGDLYGRQYSERIQHVGAVLGDAAHVEHKSPSDVKFSYCNK